MNTLRRGLQTCEDNWKQYRCNINGSRARNHELNTPQGRECRRGDAARTADGDGVGRTGTQAHRQRLITERETGNKSIDDEKDRRHAKENRMRTGREV